MSEYGPVGDAVRNVLSSVGIRLRQLETELRAYAQTELNEMADTLNECAEELDDVVTDPPPPGV